MINGVGLSELVAHLVPRNGDVESAGNTALEATRAAAAEGLADHDMADVVVGCADDAVDHRALAAQDQPGVGATTRAAGERGPGVGSGVGEEQ